MRFIGQSRSWRKLIGGGQLHTEWNELEMTRNQEKKDIEQRALAAARKAGAPIPTGELASEEPDFRFNTPTGLLGVEVSEVLRPASTNEGILPAEAETFHQSILLKAQEEYQETSGPTRVSVYFSRARGKKQDKRHLIESLVDCVARNRHRAAPTIALKGKELPGGFDHILITAESGKWWCGECGGITLSEIRTEVAAKIAAKNKLAPRYRANLPRGAQVWLLLYTRVTVSRSVPIPHGIEDWKFPFGFDRVFWFASLGNKVVGNQADRIRRGDSCHKENERQISQTASGIDSTGSGDETGCEDVAREF
jgi:hypothetical protein